MMQIVLQIVQWIYLFKYVLGYLFVILENVLKRVWLEIVSALQAQKFSERKPSQEIHFGNAA